MARALNKPTDTECRTAWKPGMLGDGGGLCLNVKPSGAKSWATSGSTMAGGAKWTWEPILL
jgi:hypothetical protein